jgi:hypothetical protein
MSAIMKISINYLEDQDVGKSIIMEISRNSIWRIRTSLVSPSSWRSPEAKPGGSGHP